MSSTPPPHQKPPSKNSTLPLHSMTLLERIRALDKSSELAHQYTALVLFDPRQSTSGDSQSIAEISSSHVAVGHVEKSFIQSTLIHCKNDNGEPIFILDELKNKYGKMNQVLRLHSDVQFENQFQLQMQQSQECAQYNGEEIHYKLFQKRTEEFEHATNHMLSSGTISHKHSDMYPVSAFVDSSTSSNANNDKKNDVLALVNRSTSPYLGIDSVGVHLHCYVCRPEQKSLHKKLNSVINNQIEGVWLAKRASTKSHHPNYWDPTVAGGQPAALSLHENIIKEAHEEAGVPSEWLSKDTPSSDIIFSDHTKDFLTITTSKPDGTCMKRSLYYSFDLQVPHDWSPTPVDGEVSAFKLYSMRELEEELLNGDSLRPAMRAVLLDFMMRHGALSTITETDSLTELRDAMRRERLELW